MVLGFAGALCVLAGLFWLVGVDDMIEALQQADARVLVFVGLAAIGWLLAWSLALRTVLASLGVHITVLESILVFVAAVFANNVTPFGQAGGEPVSALLIAHTADSDYETGLAAIVTIDTVNVLPSIVLALFGLGYYASMVTLPERLVAITVVLIVVAVCLPFAGIVLWRRRHGAQSITTSVLATILKIIGIAIPRWRPPSATAIDARVGKFVTALERVAGDRRGLAQTFLLSTLGWIGLILCLWFSLVAIGFDDPRLLAAAFVTVPLGSVAAATPFPGGLGGMEAAFVAVLTALTSLPAAALGAAVVCYRVATYWLPTVVGGAVASAFGSRW